jgi:hypothetical protein
VRPSAAVRGVGSIACERVDETCALTPNGEPGRIERAFLGGGAVGAKIDGAGRDPAADVVVDPHWKVVSIDERDIEEVGAAGAEIELR